MSGEFVGSDPEGQEWLRQYAISHPNSLNERGENAHQEFVRVAFSQVRNDRYFYDYKGTRRTRRRQAHELNYQDA